LTFADIADTKDTKKTGTIQQRETAKGRKRPVFRPGRAAAKKRQANTASRSAGKAWRPFFAAFLVRVLRDLRGGISFLASLGDLGVLGGETT